MNNLLFFSFAVVASFLLTEFIRRYTIKKNLIDVPNDRSSHTTPTPRGGGLSIVIAFLITIPFIDLLSADVLFALTGSGIIIATIGFWDDHNHIPARWRLLAHFTASFWVIYWVGNIEDIQIFNFQFSAGFLGLGIVALLLVWLLNLFNFMDGIDGIAASEAIFVLTAGALFSWLHGLEGLKIISVLLAASTFGFLLLNWPPAKIFMGDVGSAFLGMMIGVIAYANILAGISVWIWFILLGVFFVDSGITLLRRILNGEKWYEAHCSHAYQHAAKKLGHKTVTVSTILVNLFWLLPLAYLAYINPNIALYVTVVAYLPLVFIALWLKAGVNGNYQQG